MLVALLIHTYPDSTGNYIMALVRQPFEFTLVYNPKLNYCKSGRILLKSLVKIIKEYDDSWDCYNRH